MEGEKKGKNKNLIFSLHHKKKPAASVSPAFPPTDGRFWRYCVLYDVQRTYYRNNSVYEEKGGTV